MLIIIIITIIIIIIIIIIAFLSRVTVSSQLFCFSFSWDRESLGI